MSAAADRPPPATGIAQEDVHHKDKGKWLEDMRGMLILVSTVIATISFQASINPPGGVLQANENATFDELKACADNVSRPCPGEAILPIIYSDDYYSFQVCNTIAFVASLSVTLLLASGFPLRNRFLVWMLSISMIFTLSFLASAYLYAMLLVTPSVVGPWTGTVKIVKRTIVVWLVLVGILALSLTVRFLVWLLRKRINLCQNRGARSSRSPVAST